MGKARKNLGLGFVLAAFLFLFNPTASIIDPLPDFIGYWLICIGVTQLADMNYHFEESLKYFKRMLIASVVQFLSIFLLFGMVTGKERPTTFLLLSFIFAAVEILFLLRAYNEFFEGFLYLGSRMEASAVFRISEGAKRRYEARRAKEERRLEAENRRRRQKGLPERPIREIPKPKNATVGTAHLTTLFIVFRALITVLPEFSALTLSSYDEASRFNFLYDFIGMFRTFAIFLVLPFGIVWLIRVLRYVFSIMKDRGFMEALIQKYVTEVEPKTYIFIQRAVKFAFLVMSVGLVFCADIYMESNTVNILPDVICAALILVALLLLKKLVKIPVYSYVFCAVYGVFSVFTQITSSQFFLKHTLSLTDIRLESYEAFRQLQVVEIADSLLFFAMMISLLPVLSAVIKQYTGFAPVRDGNVQMDDKIRYVHNMLCKRLVVLAILSALCLVSGVCYILLVKVVTFMWIVDFLICTALAIYAILTLNAITQEVEYKYLLA